MPAPVLLTDQQVQDYLTQGYLVLRTGHPAAFHCRILRQIQTLYATEGNPGNDILPRVPDLYQDPARPGGRRGPAQPARSRLPGPSPPPLPREPEWLGRPADAPGQLRERPERAPPSYPVGDGVLLPAGRPAGAGADRHPAGQPVLRNRGPGTSAIEELPLCGAAGTVIHRPLRPVAPCHGQHQRPPPLHGQVPVHPHE